MTAQLGHQFFAPDDDSGLWPAQQLIAAKGNEIRAGLDTGLNGWLRCQAIGAGVQQGAAAQVVDQDYTLLVRQGRHLL